MNSLDFLLLRTPLQNLELAFQEPELNLDPVFSDALRLAAPDFYKEFQKLGVLAEKERNKILDSFYKYWLRSCVRCTPYGMFAGSLVVHLKDVRTSIILTKKNSHILKARLDMGYFFILKNKIEEVENVRNQLTYKVNDSLYKTSLDFRFAEYHNKDNIRFYKLTAIERTDYLEFIFDFAKSPKTLSDLSIGLARISNVSYTDAFDFVVQLIESQLLISELEPVLTGVDPLTYLIGKLDKLVGIDELISKLRTIQNLLSISGKIGYEALEREILSCFDLEGTKNVVQIDLNLNKIENVMDKSIIDEIVAQAENLDFLARASNNNDLENFKKKFIERYESEEVPLNLVLDDDLGISYGNSDRGESSEWIENLPIFFKHKNEILGQDYITKYTFQKYKDYLLNNKSEIEILSDELQGLKHNINGFVFPTSAYIFGSLINDKNIETDKKFLFDVNGLGGPSSANILGRFTLGDDELTMLTKQTIEAEEKEFPNSIFAEIVHVPQARIGNILLRSNLRKYEIPYLGKSGMDYSFQIPITDLMVSVKENKVILRSVKHKKIVFPRLSTAHNFTNNSLPIYKFLCDLQGQGFAHSGIWDWGVYKNENYLPRVRYKNLILKKARWVFNLAEIKGFSDSNNPLEIEEGINKMINNKNLPTLVVLIQGDNNLLIDLGNPKAIHLLMSFVKKYKSVVLEEFLFSSENCFVKDIDGLSYTNEVVIPVNRKPKKPIFFPEEFYKHKVQRKFPPSSEWLYFKIYGGAKTLEKILLDFLSPYILKGQKKSLFEKFFFIRYRDPEDHLRIRFFNKDQKKQLTLQAEFMDILKLFITTRQIDKVIIDTYTREIERYSGALIETSETVFFNDSVAVLKLNKLLTEVEEPSKYRMLLALRSIDSFLDEFGLELEIKLEIAKKMANGFLKEFGESSALKQSLNDKYRKVQREIFSHLKAIDDTSNNIEEAIMIFNERRIQNASVVKKIQSRHGSDNQNGYHVIIIDYVHMFMNRLFISQQRKYELVVYSFIERYYSSQNAIKSKPKK